MASWQDCKLVFSERRFCHAQAHLSGSVNIRVRFSGGLGEGLHMQSNPPTQSQLNHLKSRRSKWNNINLD